MAALTKILSQRRQAAIDRAERVAAAFPDHRSAGMEAQLELETALDDADRYQRMLTSVGGAVVRREAGPYQPDGQYSYFSDLAHVERYGAGVARDASLRLQRQRDVSADESRMLEQRDTVSGAMAGTIPPQYLLDQAATAARESSPLVDLLTKIPLPAEGVEIDLARITTGVTTDFPTEGNAPDAVDLASVALQLPVKDVMAVVSESWTLFQRAKPTNDLVIARDLGEAVGYLTEYAILNGTGGKFPIGIMQTSGVTPTAYADATPTAGELVAKVAASATSVSAARHRRPNVVVMAPRRWFWLTAQVDSSLRPIVGLTTIPPNPDSPFVGTIAGLPVVLSDAMLTNVNGDQDQIALVRTQDLVLALDDRNLTVLVTINATSGTPVANLWIGRYIVFTAGRWPSGVGIISGTGLNAVAT